MANPPELRTRFLRVGGRVQGVGFRPFVYRLARELGLAGRVANVGGEVEILIQGEPEALALFAHRLISAAPPLARPELLADEPHPAEPLDGFRIAESAGEVSPRASVPPDCFTCDDCLRELRDPADRRYRYPFINCTQCGPRYTLIARLPYDRPHTSMAGFPLCPECRAEYENPADRRFHAEPVACPVCGPQVRFEAGAQAAEGEAALAACIAALRAGRIVAVKGVGGYHLLCDARNEAAVAELRRRKPRPHKPLALMYPQQGEDGLAAVRADLAPEPAEAELLRSPERPIVLLRKRPECALAPGIAPALGEVGAMLPYSPLHHLLLDGFGGPLVATSGNLGGEPVLTDPEQAAQRLARVADAFLHHDRPILRPADDSVYRLMAGRPRPLRLGRGSAPQELTLPRPVPQPLLAVGGHTKNTVALAVEDRLIVSPHIGDLDSPRARAVFEQVAADLQAFYGVRAARIVCDAHPAYASSRWAAETGLPLTRVFHHHAHASALYAEHETAHEHDWLVFAWDGVGLGEDGSLWGGEALLGRPGRWRRVASLRPFRLPGGEKAGREPWRSAAALCWETGVDWAGAPDGTGLLITAWARGLNAPLTSAAGRLFDAAAALTGVLQNASFEGQGPMMLEALAAGVQGAAPMQLSWRPEPDGVLRLDWAPLLPMLLDPAAEPALRAARFHASLAAALARLAAHLHRSDGFHAVGLTGGVFQNRLLAQSALKELAARGLDGRLALRVPCNDGGISAGQVFEALAACRT